MDRSRESTRRLSTALFLSAALSLLSLVAAPAGTDAAPNPEINYQGKLTDASNIAVADGVYHMRFWLLASPTAPTSTALWSEDRSAAPGNRVRVQNGLFSVMLGSSTPLASVDFSQTLYLGVEIGGAGGPPSWDGEMSPRKVLGTVPSAFETDHIDGLDSTQFLRSDTATALASTSASTLLTITQSGPGDILNVFDGATEVFSILDGGGVGIGQTSPGSLLHVGGGAETLTITPTAQIAASLGSSTLAIAAPNTAGASAQLWLENIGQRNWTISSDRALDALTIAANNDTARLMTILSNGNVGIGTTTPGSLLTVAGRVTIAGSANPRLYLASSDVGNVSSRVMDVSGTDWRFYREGGAEGTAVLMTLDANGALAVTGAITEAGSAVVSSADIDTSAELAAIVGDETGSGALVFATSPTLTGTAAFAALTTTGNVGIGTTSPGYKLDVYGHARLGAANPALYLTGTKSGGNEWFLQSVDSDGRFRIYDQTTNAERMTLTQSGNVGIGTTSPSRALSVGGSGYLSGGLGVGRSHGTTGEIWASSHVLADGAVYGAYSAGSGVAFVVGNDTTIRDIDIANTLAIYGASDNAVASLKLGSGGGTISGAGVNIGIGTTSPLAKLHASGAGGLGGAGLFESTDSYNSLTVKGVDGGGINDSAILWFKDQADENTLIGLVGTASAGSGEVGDLRFIVDNSERMRIAKGGGIGIGVVDPGASLDVSGTGANQCCATFVPTLSLAEDGTIRNPSIQFHSEGFQEAYLRLASSTRSLDIGDSQGAGAALGIMNAAGTFRAVSISGSASSYFSGGNVGIGTTSPQTILHVGTTDQSSNRLRLENRGSGGKTWDIVGGLPGVNNANFSIYDFNNSATRLTIDSSGNVGIGTTTPGSSTKLNVAGRGLFTGGTSDPFDGTEPGTTIGFDISGNYGFIDALQTGVASRSLVLNQSGGNVGIGTTSPAGTLGVAGTIFSNNLLLQGDNSNAYVRPTNAGNLYLGAANTNVLTLSSNELAFLAGGARTISGPSDGELNINSSDVLDLNNSSGGNVRLFLDHGSGSELGLLVYDYAAASNDYVSISHSGAVGRIRSSSSADPIALQDGGGNVGIGTTTPTGTLHVVGGTSASTHGTSITLAAQNAYAGNPFLNLNGGKIILLPGAKFGTGVDGNVGIGTTNPDQGKLEVKGGTVCVDTDNDDNASSCIASESDARLKTSVETLNASSSLATLLALNPVSFDWKVHDPTVLAHYPLIARFAETPHSIGLIAQEVRPLLPEAIGLETVGDDEVQYLQLDYTKLVPIIISAVQAIHARLAALGEQVSALIAQDDKQNTRNFEQDARISELEAEVRSLRDRIVDDDDGGTERDDDPDPDPDPDPGPGPATLPPDPAMGEPPVEASAELDSEPAASDTDDVVEDPPESPSEPVPVSDPAGGTELPG